MITTAVGRINRAVYLLAVLKNARVFSLVVESSLENAGSNAVVMGRASTLIKVMKLAAALKLPISLSDVNMASMRFW